MSFHLLASSLLTVKRGHPVSLKVLWASQKRAAPAVHGVACLCAERLLGLASLCSLLGEGELVREG